VRSSFATRCMILLSAMLLLGLWITDSPAQAAAKGKKPTLAQRVAATETKMASLQKQVSSLSATVTAQGKQVSSLSAPSLPRESRSAA
jgi:hypothetical protein